MSVEQYEALLEASERQRAVAAALSSVRAGASRRAITYQAAIDAMPSYFDDHPEADADNYPTHSPTSSWPR